MALTGPRRRAEPGSRVDPCHWSSGIAGRLALAWTCQPAGTFDGYARAPPAIPSPPGRRLAVPRSIAVAADAGAAGRRPVLVRQPLPRAQRVDAAHARARGSRGGGHERLWPARAVHPPRAGRSRQAAARRSGGVRLARRRHAPDQARGRGGRGQGAAARWPAVDQRRADGLCRRWRRRALRAARAPASRAHVPGSHSP